MINRLQRASQRVAHRRRLADRPVFVIGMSHRTGSTLVQRLLCSADDCFIWGEGNGATSLIVESSGKLSDWTYQYGDTFEELKQWGTNAFLANITPRQNRIDSAHRQLLAGLYDRDPNENRMKRWGYKEVRHTHPETTELLRLFPQARIVVVGRQLSDVVASLLRWENDSTTDWHDEWTLAAVKTWVTNVADFAKTEDNRILPIRYEDLVERPEPTIARIEEHLDFRTGSVDRAILDTRVHRDGPTGRQTAKPAQQPASEALQLLLAEQQTAEAEAAYDVSWPSVGDPSRTS